MENFLLQRELRIFSKREI